MLDRKEFGQLNFKEKCAEITFKGKLLVSKKFGIHQVFLFWLAGFYVELWFNNVKGEIHGINTFEGTDGLEFYLQDFSIERLEKIVTNEE